MFLAPILLHQNPKYYPNPTEFQPERFLPKNLQDKNPFSYIPFSGEFQNSKNDLSFTKLFNAAGPRNCIGQKFAMMEEKVVIANILRRFTLEPAQKMEDAKCIMELTLKPKDGPMIKIKEKQLKNPFSR